MAWTYIEDQWLTIHSGTRVSIGAQGELLSIESSKATMAVAEDALILRTDRGALDTRALPAVASVEGDVLRFTYRTDLGELCIEHRLTPDEDYCRRPALSVAQPTALHSVQWVSRLCETPSESIEYKTFWNAATCFILRYPNHGWMTGVENPFFHAELLGSELSVSYEAALLLDQGACYEGEAQFFIPYLPAHQYIANVEGAFLPSKAEGVDRYRFRNPSGHIPLDLREIEAMRRYIERYLDVIPRPFVTILYMYWVPVEQMPSTEEGVRKYKAILSNFKRLGGEMVLFTPLHPYPLPDGKSVHEWELAPAGSFAAEILQYTRDLGLQYGFYMGVATHGDQGNASALPFMPEEKAWKKRWADGAQAPENCIGSEAFLDWWLNLHTRTIEAYQLDAWSWDPGPGNAAHCHAENHGHLPGHGDYRGFQNSMRFLKRLRQRHPDLYLMSFYGRKEFGPWGFKYFDQQESYWEQTIGTCASLHPDLHDDRVNAHGVRLQNYWNQCFRFLPPRINHALVHRIGEHYYPPDTMKLWDHGGWRCALLSAVSASASITLDILPEDLGEVPGMVEFYREWLQWAQENLDTVRCAVPFGGQVEPGRFDGVARITQDKGVIFLFNSGPLPIRDHFILGEALGFTDSHPPVALRMMFPAAGQYNWNPEAGSGLFRPGAAVPVSLAPYEAQVWALDFAHEARLAYGIGGDMRVEGGALVIEAPPYERGYALRISTSAAVDRCLLNGRTIPLAPGRVNERYAEVAAGTRALSRAVMDWRTDDGEPFPLFAGQACETIAITSTLSLEEGLAEHVARLAEGQPPEKTRLAQKYLNKEEGELFHNFLWAMPGAAYLVVHTRTTTGLEDVSGELSGRPLAFVPFTLDRQPLFWYATLTPDQLGAGDRALRLTLHGLKAGQFIGAYLEVAPYGPTDGFSPAAAPPAYCPPRRDVSERVDASPHRILRVSLTPERVAATGAKAVARAWIDADGGEIADVYIENATQPSMHRMAYDATERCWVVQVPIGARARNIMDAPCFHIWARDAHGRILDEALLPFQFRG